MNSFPPSLNLSTKPGQLHPWKKDGKPTMTSHVVVSKDGKSLTVHQTGKSAKGEAVASTVIFDKQ